MIELPEIFNHPDIALLVGKWEAVRGRRIYGNIEIDKDKWILYFDPDFVRDMAIKMQRLIDQERKNISHLVDIRNNLEEKC